MWFTISDAKGSLGSKDLNTKCNLINFTELVFYISGFCKISELGFFSSRVPWAEFKP